MQTVNLVEAKAHLSRLVDLAKDGGAVRKRIVVSALRSLTDAMTPQKESAADAVRDMRDEARY